MQKVGHIIGSADSSIIEPAILLDEAELSDAMKPDIVVDTDFKSISLIPPTLCDDNNDNDNETKRSFLLMDSNETLRVLTAKKFCEKLNCSENHKIKVVSIFGNTGDGKSHTMNHTFFNGEEVFRTSSEQNSCTIGVWAAMQLNMGVLCLDTEGLLGTTSTENRRMRMLLKILAISDIVIYRTRAERLHSDMFNFLGNASKAFCRHFASALQSLVLPGSAKASTALGPAVIIFHETQHTRPLESTVKESAEDILRDRFGNMNIDTDAFSSLRYVGIQSSAKQTDYSHIRNAMRLEIENTAVRSSRHPGVVFKAMKALNLKFSGEITEKPINPFPEQYFTCPVTCESCGRRCERSMGHFSDGEDHSNSELCLYQHQFENKVYLCKICHSNSRKVVVTIRTQGNGDGSLFGLAKYAWSGSVIECRHCGEIYRSRQYWFGNKSPEDVAVRAEIVHVWKDGNITARGPKHSAQMVLDSVSYLSEAISSIGAQPSKAITDWVADKFAPSYWKPNSDIIICHGCKKNFERQGLSKHHCRNCGEGFCVACTEHQLPVPARGWHQPVRVCNQCYEELLKKQRSPSSVKKVEKIVSRLPAGMPDEMSSSGDGDILVRKYGEAVYNTINSVVSVLEYPKDLIKDSARPSYWVPDVDAPNCALCRTPFGTAEELILAQSKGSTSDKTSISPTSQQRTISGDCRRHHCRACGQAICDACSTSRRPVPERGWTSDVRVCDGCVDKTKMD